MRLCLEEVGHAITRQDPKTTPLLLQRDIETFRQRTQLLLHKDDPKVDNDLKEKTSYLSPVLALRKEPYSSSYAEETKKNVFVVSDQSFDQSIDDSIEIIPNFEKSFGIDKFELMQSKNDLKMLIVKQDQNR